MKGRGGIRSKARLVGLGAARCIVKLSAIVYVRQLDGCSAVGSFTF